MNLILIGFMGVGKTSVGKRLAQCLGWPFMDTDSLIERARAMKVGEIFETYGEESFRKTETEVISRVSKLQSCVIATGGGAILDPLNTARMKESGFLVHLSLSLETICKRIGHQTTRPVLQRESSRDSLEKFYHAREALYEACSDIKIDRTGMDEDETVRKILQIVKG